MDMGGGGMCYRYKKSARLAEMRYKERIHTFHLYSIPILSRAARHHMGEYQKRTRLYGEIDSRVDGQSGETASDRPGDPNGNPSDSFALDVAL